MKDILYGVKLAVIEEISKTTQLVNFLGTSCSVDTAESVEMEPVEDEGKEDVARSDEKILAIVRTPDLLYGYDVTMTDNTFDPEIAALIEGGTVTKESDEVVGYRSPLLSEGASKMKPFRLTLFVANYEGDSIKNYAKVIMNNCTGKAPKFSAAKKFYAPEFEIKAREATKAGLPIKNIEYVDELPSTTAPTVTAATVGELGTGTIAAVPSSTTASALIAGITLSQSTAEAVVTDANGNEVVGTTVITSSNLLFAYNEDSGIRTKYTLATV